MKVARTYTDQFSLAVLPLFRRLLNISIGLTDHKNSKYFSNCLKIMQVHKPDTSSLLRLQRTQKKPWALRRSLLSLFGPTLCLELDGFGLFQAANVSHRDKRREADLICLECELGTTFQGVCYLSALIEWSIFTSDCTWHHFNWDETIQPTWHTVIFALYSNFACTLGYL